MLKKMLITGFVAALVSLPSAASAVTIGADELLGIIVPGTPADEANEAKMINGLLNGWTVGSVVTKGYNQGASSGTVMGNNPSDDQNETYTLKFSSTSKLPAAGSATGASTPGYRDTSGNATFNLGNFTYKWVLAKWGPDSAVYYIGHLAANTEVTLSRGGTGFAAQGHGLSHYTLFNRTAVTTNGGGNGGDTGNGGNTVPDGGTSLMLLGVTLVAVGAARRRFGV